MRFSIFHALGALASAGIHMKNTREHALVAEHRSEAGLAGTKR